MKKTLLVALLSLACSLSSFCQATDTIVGRCPDYYYNGWYDECPRYHTDTNNFALDGYSQPVSGDGANNRIVYMEQYSPGPITVRGVAVMVAMAPELDPVAGHYMPPADSLRLPELIYIYQGGPAIPGLSPYYFPRQMTLLDSVRWDTAAPKIMIVPKNAGAVASADTSQMLRCYVYEALFDTAVTVQDTFYFAGTFRSNTLNDSNHLSHFPTDYVVVRDMYTDPCDKCPVAGRLFFGLASWPTEYLEVFNWNWFLSGPFLPILDR